jgi:hypothetical protein
VNATIEPTRARSRPIRRRKVVGALRAWLAELELDGADQVRATMALVLAAELDDPTAPRYSRAKIASELRAVLAELEPRELAFVDDHGELDVRALLAEVLR